MRRLGYRILVSPASIVRRRRCCLQSAVYIAVDGTRLLSAGLDRTLQHCRHELARQFSFILTTSDAVENRAMSVCRYVRLIVRR